MSIVPIASITSIVPMVTIPGKVMEKLRRFLSLITEDGIRPEKTILFGSYAKGNPGKWSDLDVAPGSKDFIKGFRIYRKGWKAGKNKLTGEKKN